MSLTDRDRKILIAVVPIVLLFAYWFLVLSPKRQEITKADEQLTTQEQRLDVARQQANASEGAETNFASDYAEIVRLGKAIPASVDMPSLIVQLDRAAAGTSIQFTKIATGASETPPPVAAPAGSTTPPAGGAAPAPVAAGGQPAASAPGGAAEAATNAQQTADQRSSAAEQSGVSPGDAQTSTSSGGALPVGGGAAGTGSAATPGAPPAGLQTVPLDLEFQGDFFNLAAFFHQLKRFVRVANQDVAVRGRLVTIEGVHFASDPELFPRIRAELSATVYLSPKAEGATAGATPQGPSTTPPAATPTTSSTPVPTATATP